MVSSSFDFVLLPKFDIELVTLLSHLSNVAENVSAVLSRFLLKSAETRDKEANICSSSCLNPDFIEFSNSVVNFD